VLSVDAGGATVACRIAVGGVGTSPAGALLTTSTGSPKESSSRRERGMGGSTRATESETPTEGETRITRDCTSGVVGGWGGDVAISEGAAGSDTHQDGNGRSDAATGSADTICSAGTCERSPMDASLTTPLTSRPTTFIGLRCESGVHRSSSRLGAGEATTGLLGTISLAGCIIVDAPRRRASRLFMPGADGLLTAGSRL